MSNFETIRYPMVYESSKIMMHKKCSDELKKLIDKSGKKTRFAAQFKIRLDFLARHGANAVQHDEWFEDLKHTNGIYAIRFVSIDNIRILYVIHNSAAFLLHAFKETSKGNDGKSYSHGIEIAYTRLNDL